jgi:hypothetical protein
MRHKRNRFLLTIVLVGLALVLSACGDGGGASHDGHGAAPGQQPGETSGDHNGHGGQEGVSASSLQIDWNFTASPVAGNATPLTFTVKKETGEVVSDFEIGHEKKMHLIAVDETLTDFMHLHPELQSDGTFTIDVPFSHGGNYTLFADFIPKGEAAMTLSQDVQVEGEPVAGTAFIPDIEAPKVVNGIKIALTMPEPTAGEEVKLSFAFENAETGDPITNLQPYLGAVGHVVILDDKAEKYIHNHPLEEAATGPVADFETMFPEPGTYKIWGQFQHEGELFVVPFVAEVK